MLFVHYTIAFLYLLAITQSLTCKENQQRVKVVKKSTVKAREESVEIWNPNEELLFTGENYADGELREDEVCLDNSVVFTLVMKDSHEDGWSDGSYVEIITENGNSATKSFITSREGGSISAEGQQETIQFTLYSSINKGDTWNFSNSVETGWNSDTSYNDQGWQKINISNTQSLKASGVHYFRHVFEKPAFDYAAIELHFLYRDGIVVYINGEVVFQDNILIGGASSSSITVNGAYNTVDYRGTIIPLLLDVKYNVIAVEIHTEDLGERKVQFDAFLTYHLANAQTNAAHCYVVPTTYTITTDSKSINQDSLMWSRNTYHTISRQQLSTPESRSLKFNVIGNVYPSVNGIRMWPSEAFSYAPQSFKLSSGTTTATTTLVDTRLADYVSGEYKVFLSHAQSSLSPTTSALELEVRSAMEEEVHLNLQFLVCSIRPAIDLQPLTLNYFSVNPPNEIDLGIYGVTECQIIGNLPSELSFHEDTCKITRGGKTNGQEYVGKTFTVTASATAFGKPETAINRISRIVNIKYDTCDLTNRALLNITRVYASNPSSEGFRIRNGNSIIFEEKPGTTQIAHSVKTTFFCVASKTYEVELTSSINSWARNSYLYITSILPGDEEDMLLRARYCSLQGNEHIYYFHTHSIKPRAEWHYKMGSIPSDWLTATSSYTGMASYPNYPASTNQIQLYQKTFLIDNLNKVAGIILGIRYRYGCIVYINGHEIWRNGVEGSLSTATFSNHEYTSMKWRFISLPAVLQEVLTPAGVPVHYLIQGTNRICIAIISKSSQGSSFLTSNFDAMLRLMREIPESHTWAVDMSNVGMDGIATNVFDGYMDSTIYHHSCASNSLTISFQDDRREWISSIHIQNYYGKKEKGVTHFILQGGIQDEWETITTVSGLTWSMAGQKRRIYFANTKAYNSYRFINLGTNNPSDCEWLVQSLQLYADNIVEELPPLTYNDETIIFKDIEMAEITPIYGHTGYFNFRITPPLPNVLTIDPTTGWISGTPITDCNRTTYTVFATTYTGVEVNTTLTIECEKCTGTMGLITVRYRTDTYPHENSWRLYYGENTDVESIRLMEYLPEANSYYYADFCMPSGSYTFIATNAHKEGWASNTGYTITVDYGDMEIDTMQMAAGQYDTVSVTSVFSTYIPFQVQYTEWHVYGGSAAPPDGWKTSDMSNGWSKYFAANIPPSEQVTTYIRHSFALTGEDQYNVLNVRVKYIGGVAAYFNGKLVARFNLEANPDHNTESMIALNDPIFSKFHILISTNYMSPSFIAFEVHRPLGTSGKVPVVFDATGVFGVESYANKVNSNEKCITVVDSYSLQSSPLLSGSLDDIMDLDPFTVGALPNTVGSYMEWVVDNLEGSLWNQLNMYVPADLQGLGIDLFAWNANQDKENEKVLLLHEPSLTITSRVLPEIDVPYAMGAFRRYRMQVINTVSQPILINSLFMKYCFSTTTTSICTQSGKYPSVQRGELSIHHSCGINKYGFTYKQCDNSFGPTIDKCELKPIEGFRYKLEDYNCEVGVVCRMLLVDIDREQFTIDQIIPSPALPEGFTMDDYGHIEGRPTASLETTIFTIYAENSYGRVFTTFTLTITHITKEIHEASYEQESYELMKDKEFVTKPKCVDEDGQALNCRYSITYENRPLPAGLTLDETTGTISGRPTEVTRTFVVITVENEEGEKTLFIEFDIMEENTEATQDNGTIIGIVVAVVVVVVVMVIIFIVYVLLRGNPCKTNGKLPIRERPTLNPPLPHNSV